ncbi:MAG: hypothetical protein ABJO09_00335 [Hyphomicrobiales bacterium]
MSILDQQYIVDTVQKAEFGRPFLIALDRLESSKPVLTIHASNASMSKRQARLLRKELSKKAQFSNLVLNRYSMKKLEQPKSLEAFLSPFMHEQIVFDPTGAFERSEKLVSFASRVRDLCNGQIYKVLWHSRNATLHIVFNRSLFSDDRTTRTRDLVLHERKIRIALLEVVGPDTASFVKSMELGFSEPASGTTPVDSRSFKLRLNSTHSSGIARKFGSILSALAASLSIGAVSAAHGQELGSAPTVSGSNGEFSLKGGIVNDEPAGVADIMLTVPLSEQVGAKIDAVFGTIDENKFAGGAARLFWRNPYQGAFGIMGGYWGSEQDQPGGGTGWEELGIAAFEGEVYLNQTTLSGMVGFQFSDDFDDGFVGQLELQQYFTDDFLIKIGVETNPQHDVLGTSEVEYRPGFAALPGLSLFVDGAVGENDYYRAYGGIRIYFGMSDTLKKRHRFDTYRSYMPGTLDEFEFYD